MKKAYKYTGYTYQSLCILFLIGNTFEWHPFIQIGLALLFFTALISYLILGYQLKKTSCEREKEIAGEVIAALEACDYKSTIEILDKFKNGNTSRLGDAFHFYCLGILVERTSVTKEELIENMDGFRERLFTDKVIENED